MKFSVCMSVYKNDNTTDFADAVLSIYNQTCRPDEIILVIDGPVPAIMHDTISALNEQIGWKLPVNWFRNMLMPNWLLPLEYIAACHVWVLIYLAYS